MKKSALTLVLVSVILNLGAQNTTHCLSDERLKNWLENNPEKRMEYFKNQEELKISDSIAFALGSANRPTAAVVYTIPVVFHILHQNGPENISDGQVLDEMNILNKAYRKLNADTAYIYAPFQAADVYFEFRLATKDTNGFCTNGIVHHYDPINTYWSYPASINQYKYTWDSKKYLNIYLVTGITGFSYGGYGMFPGTAPAVENVVVVTHDCVGSIGTSTPFKSRILTHEIGHWFNLRHLWGNTTFGTACGDDGVSDTPVTMGTSGCPSSPPAICNPTITENFQNYMDYSTCPHMFTAGQVNRMTLAITSTVSGRNNLWTNSNLIATGVINPQSPCAPIAYYYANTYTVCQGNGLVFHDGSYNGSVSSRTWSASNGIVSLPQALSTLITFTATGTQTVTLNTTNTVGSSATTSTVQVLSNIAEVGYAYSESFEGQNPPPNFSIINPYNDVTWSPTFQAAASGATSYFIDGSQDNHGAIDILETPSYDFLNNPGASFTFKYAYARYDSAHHDLFKILASDNCGGTWYTVYAPSSLVLSNGSGGTTSIPFFPTPTEFKTYTLTANGPFQSFLNSPNVRIRFYFREDTLTGNGNNIFLDDINFDSSNIEGINELSKSLSWHLYPNPSGGNITVEFILSNDSRVNYFVTDLSGRTMEQEKVLKLNAGSHKVSLNESRKLKPGMYLLHFFLNGQEISRKFVIE